MKIKSYKDLITWQMGMQLVEEVYTITRGFPKEELYGLTQQLRRAAVSIPSNIAEGHTRIGSREFVHRLSIAHGSLAEVETQIEIARRLGYIRPEQVAAIDDMASEVGRIINGLINSLEKLAPGPRPLAAGQS